MHNSKFRLGLLSRIVIAIVLGIALGIVLPSWGVRVFVTFNALFSQFLGFLIPLIIVGLVTPAIADLGRGGGRMLLITVLLAYGSTLLSGAISYVVSASAFPQLITPQAVSPAADSAASALSGPWFTVEIPPLMDVMSAIFLSFVVGLGIAYTQASSLRSFFGEFKSVVELTISKALLPLLPLYIMGIFMQMTASGEVARTLRVFASIIVVIFVMHILWLLFLYAIAGLVAHKRPLPLLRTMLPAYLMALGTSSSAATIPVTLRQTLRNGVSGPVAGFVVPLCATIHLSGSMQKIVACSVALMLMRDMPFSAGLFAGFICLLAITVVAAPGVPGGVVMAALGVLSSVLGFGEQELALIIALYIAMDSFGTACNVTGDGALALVVDRIFARSSRSN